MWQTSGKTRQADDRTSLIRCGGRPIGAIVEKEGGKTTAKSVRMFSSNTPKSMQAASVASVGKIARTARVGRKFTGACGRKTSRDTAKHHDGAGRARTKLTSKETT
jgi:hypothetical protein